MHSVRACIYWPVVQFRWGNARQFATNSWPGRRITSKQFGEMVKSLSKAFIISEKKGMLFFKRCDHRPKSEYINDYKS